MNEERGRARSVESIGLGLILLVIACSAAFCKIFLNPARMLWGQDILRLHLPQRIVQWQAVREWGTFPIWDPSMCCGQSILGDSSAAVLAPLGLMFWFIPSPIVFGFLLWLYVVLAAWGMFLYARRTGLDAAGALFAAVTFALSAKVAAYVFSGQVAILTAMLGLPWIMRALDGALQRQDKAPTASGNAPSFAEERRSPL